MNYDICFCTNRECKLRMFCRRHVDHAVVGGLHFESRFVPYDTQHCKYFLGSTDTITDTKLLEELINDNPR